MTVFGSTDDAYCTALESELSDGSWSEEKRTYLHWATVGILGYMRSKGPAFGVVANLPDESRGRALRMQKRAMRDAAYGSIGAISIFAFILKAFLSWMIGRIINKLIDHWNERPSALAAVCGEPFLDRQ